MPSFGVTPPGARRRAHGGPAAGAAAGHTHGVPRKPTTIDAYLATVSHDRRLALQRLRRTILAVVPRAEECFSYGMPAFRVDGEVVAGFAATTKGCSYFPFSGSTLGSLASDLAGYDMTKSSLHFAPERPLPVALVKKLLRVRRAEIRAKRAPRAAREAAKKR